MSGVPGSWTTKAPGFPSPETRVPGSGPLGVGGGGAIVRVGFDNSVEDLTYSSSTTPILRSAGVPLTIPLTGFQPGNVILIQFSVVGEDAIGSGPIVSLMLLVPSVDLGAGPRLVHVSEPLASSTGEKMLITFVSFVRPVPAEVLADPVVGLVGTFVDDTTRILAYGALLTASEVAEGFVTQAPTTFLDP